MSVENSMRGLSAKHRERIERAREHQLPLMRVYKFNVPGADGEIGRRWVYAVAQDWDYRAGVARPKVTCPYAALAAEFGYVSKIASDSTQTSLRLHGIAQETLAEAQARAVRLRDRIIPNYIVQQPRVLHLVDGAGI